MGGGGDRSLGRQVGGRHMDLTLAIVTNLQKGKSNLPREQSTPSINAPDTQAFVSKHQLISILTRNNFLHSSDVSPPTRGPEGLIYKNSKLMVFP